MTKAPKCRWKVGFSQKYPPGVFPVKACLRIVLSGAGVHGLRKMGTDRFFWSVPFFLDFT